MAGPYLPVVCIISFRRSSVISPNVCRNIVVSQDETKPAEEAAAATATPEAKKEEGEGAAEAKPETKADASATEEAEPDAPAAEEPQSEERIRGGGKVTGDRGRHGRRHQPYQNNNRNSDGDRTCRVYVGNLSWNVSWQDLKDHMKTTGLEVTRANIMTTPDGRSKGCGIVEFATAEGAQQAVLTLNDTELNGRQIFVREDREDRNSGGGYSSYNNRSNAQGHRFTSGAQSQSRRVYVGNLSWDVRWQDLKDHMRQAGEVLHAEVICESNGRSKGCGIVEPAVEANHRRQRRIAVSQT